jgi:glucose/arabinose dehydrogenase
LWLPDGTMLVSIGDGGNPPVQAEGVLSRFHAQMVGSHIGKVLRLNDDGSAAAGNPIAAREGAAPEVWTMGHRNIQGMALDPETGRVWATEHGARGGDELNLLAAGKNYGWHLVTFSREYSGPAISNKTTMPGMEDPKAVWTPCIAPSGLVFYTGDAIPAWKGDLFAGGLVGQQIRRVMLDGDRVVGQETLRFDQRVREVRQGPDGFMYVLTDERDGKLTRIVSE